MDDSLNILKGDILKVLRSKYETDYLPDKDELMELLSGGITKDLNKYREYILFLCLNDNSSISMITEETSEDERLDIKERLYVRSELAKLLRGLYNIKRTDYDRFDSLIRRARHRMSEIHNEAK